MTAITDAFPGSSLSGNWTILAGTATVSGGVVTCATAPFAAVYTGATWGPNQKVAARLSAIVSAIGIYSRLNTSNFNGYDLILTTASGGSASQNRLDGGVPTEIHFGSGLGVTSGDIYALDPGTTSDWDIVKNGTVLGSSVHDATYTTGGFPGFYLDAVGDAISQWSADDGAGGGGRTLFYRSGLDGLTSTGPKQLNPSLG